MRLRTCAVTLLAAPLAAVAIPTNNAAIAGVPTGLLSSRQAGGPPPCVRMDPAPTQEETEARFEAFVEAFVGSSKNITKAFEYITEDYIVCPSSLCCERRLTKLFDAKNHNPMASNGHASAWRILGPIWQQISHTYLRSTMQGEMSWVNYRAAGLGEVVDRFRWEAGCIAEHVCAPTEPLISLPYLIPERDTYYVNSGTKERGTLPSRIAVSTVRGMFLGISQLGAVR